jgi:hypothetical protein
MKQIATLATLSILLSGCVPAAVPILKGQHGWAEDESGRHYCSQVATNADKSAQRYLGTGIVMSLAAGGAIIAGTAMGPDTSNDANWAAKNRNTLVLGTGGILAIPATVLLMRSRDASTASAAAGQAMGLDNNKALNQCLQARSDLVNARSAIADFATKDLLDKIKPLQDVRDKKEQERVAKQAAADNSQKDSEDQKQKQKEADQAAAVVKAADDKIIEVLREPPGKP